MGSILNPSAWHSLLLSVVSWTTQTRLTSLVPLRAVWPWNLYLERTGQPVLCKIGGRISMPRAERLHMCSEVDST